MKVSVTGGPPTPICHVGAALSGASWGDDHQIIFATIGSPTGLLSVPAAGGEPTVLTTTDSKRAEVRHLLPFVLPGGDLLFTAITAAPPPNNRNVMLLNRASGEQTLLLPGAAEAEYVDPGYLIYGAAGVLRAVGYDRRAHHLLGESLPVVDRVFAKTVGQLGELLMFGSSRDGALAYVVDGSPGLRPIAQREVVWVSRTGQEAPIAGLKPNAYVYARISPDRTRIALDIRDQNQDIWIYDIAREQLTPLTRDPALETSPVWTPDSKKIVFGSGIAGAVNLYWQAADGSGPSQRLSASAVNQVPHAVVDNDGLHVLFTQIGGGANSQALDGRHPVGNCSTSTARGRSRPCLSNRGASSSWESLASFSTRSTSSAAQPSVVEPTTCGKTASVS